MKPSVFTEHPWGSTLQNSQCETIARNIMAILKRTGDTFRELKWEEYKLERLRDSDFTESEKQYFDQVISYCANEERAMTFSPDWRDAYIKALKAESVTQMYTSAQMLHMLKEYDRELKSDTFAYTKPCPYTVEEWFTKKNL